MFLPLSQHLLPQPQPDGETNQPDERSPAIAEEVRRKLENMFRQQTRQRDDEGEQREGDEHIADQSRMSAHIEFIHQHMPPPDTDFFKQKLLRYP